MVRLVFVSYQDEDQLTANGFDLIKYNKHLDLCFIGRHLLDPIKVDDAAYADRKIRQQIRDSSVTIVILGYKLANSEWVTREIQWSLEKRPPNGIVSIRLSPEAKIPDHLSNYGAEILEWQRPDDIHEFQGAIRRAALAAKRATQMPVNSSTTCVRIPISRPPPVAPQSGRPSSAFEGPQREQLSDAEAIALAVDVAIDGWQQATADRLADALGEKIWTEFTRRWHPGNCHALAEIARELLELKAKSHDAVGELADWLTDQLLERFERPTIEREIACALVRALAKKIRLPTDDVLTESARTLRIIGIYVCVQFGRNLGDCQCLKDLVHDLFKDLAENLAFQELKNIVHNVENNVRPELTSEELEEIVRNVLTEM